MLFVETLFAQTRLVFEVRRGGGAGGLLADCVVSRSFDLDADAHVQRTRPAQGRFACSHNPLTSSAKWFTDDVSKTFATLFCFRHLANEVYQPFALRPLMVSTKSA